MKTYTLFWLTGKSEIVTGNTPTEAMTLAGYGGGAIRALDFYAEGDKRDKYIWNPKTNNWDSNEIIKTKGNKAGIPAKCVSCGFMNSENCNTCKILENE
jgi:hypothetical protein